MSGIMVSDNVLLIGTILENDLIAGFVTVAEEDDVAVTLKAIIESAIESVDTSVPEDKLFLLESLENLSTYINKEIALLNKLNAN